MSYEQFGDDAAALLRALEVERTTVYEAHARVPSHVDQSIVTMVFTGPTRDRSS